MNAKKIIVLTGTTAVGKTETALALARENNAEILSCDSTNVYRGMDIGTAKPTLRERALVPHHGIDLVAPNEIFSVADYAAFAQKTVAEIFSRGRNVLVCGGSGFYLKTFFAPTADALEISPDVRRRVAEILARGNDFARKTLRALNAGKNDAPTNFAWENPRRVAKGLERCLASGKTLAALKKEFSERKCAFDAFPRRCILLVREKDDLNRRIATRVEKMLAEGLVDEVCGLVAAGTLRAGTPAGNAIGYRETLAWLDAKEQGGTAALADAIALSTRQLAAKQRKWFRTQIPVDEIRNLTDNSDEQREKTGF